MADALVSPFLDVVELAKLLRCHPETLRRRLRAGTCPVPSVRLPGGRYRFRRDVVDAWLDLAELEHQRDRAFSGVVTELQRIADDKTETATGRRYAAGLLAELVTP